MSACGRARARRAAWLAPWRVMATRHRRTSSVAGARADNRTGGWARGVGSVMSAPAIGGWALGGGGHWGGGHISGATLLEAALDAFAAHAARVFHQQQRQVADPGAAQGQQIGA